MDAGVVFGNDADIVFDDSLAEVFPTLMGFLVWSGRGREDIGGEKVGAEDFGDFRPAHDLVDGKKFEELGFKGDLGIAGIFVDAVEKVRLFVVVGSEDDEVDDSLEGL